MASLPTQIPIIILGEERAIENIVCILSMNRSDLMEKDANYKRYNFALIGYKQD